MPFPEATRVIYGKNPLDRVICQLRFPPILRVDKEIPADYQERIRKDFPGFCERGDLGLAMPQKTPKGLPLAPLRQMIQAQNKNYEFTSENGIWTVNLTRTFLALSTKKYIRREDFQEHLDLPLRALVDIYKPSYFSRVGLRYVDIIRRSILNLEGVNWAELLKPHALGLLGVSAVRENVRALESQCLVALEDKESLVRIVTALVENEEGNGEECFMIDTDFYTTEKTPVPGVAGRLEYFHVRASRLIQWFITDRLSKAMEPQVL